MLKRELKRAKCWATLWFWLILILIVYVSVSCREHHTFDITKPDQNTGRSIELLHNVRSCEVPGILLLVLTSTRYASLRRLLESLSAAEYGCTKADLQINIDSPLDKNLHLQYKRCVSTASAFKWTHGKKTVFRRLFHVGLSISWFEVPFLSSGHDYIAIFEDDMEVHPLYFSFFYTVTKEGAFTNDSITAFCCHPNDWDLKTAASCDGKHSQLLFESPEPCNWGPIWKYEAWTSYVDWVSDMRSVGEMPYVHENISFNFNKYLDDGLDVQSSWVWRYNFDFNMTQIRYSFKRCFNQTELYLAINHKEAGEHFPVKMNLSNDPGLLLQGSAQVWEALRREAKKAPQPCVGFERTTESKNVEEG